jgi:hypothetical protein
LDKWTEYLEAGGQVDVIYTDFEKAFDKVPHKRLIDKLHSYGVNKEIIQWIKAFLCKRRQRVKINGYFSVWREVFSGIPQGSILGPILFIIFINDLVDVCGISSELFLYADDAKLFKHIRDTVDTNALQNDLDKFKQWSDRWLLKLNPKKCRVVSYGRRTVIDSDYTIMDSNSATKLQRQQDIKDLGVVFDSHLKFDIHINEKVNRAYSILGIIKRNFNNISKEVFLLLYKTLVRSHLEYANTVWNPYRQQLVELIEKVQKRATKLIKECRHLDYGNRLRKLDLPTLVYRRYRGDMIMVYNILTGKYDCACGLTLHRVTSTLTRGNRFKLLHHQVHYDLRKYFFSTRVTHIWNSLPDYVVSADSINIFKKHLDIFWANQEMKFNWKAVITGIGNRSY